MQGIIIQIYGVLRNKKCELLKNYGLRYMLVVIFIRPSKSKPCDLSPGCSKFCSLIMEEFYNLNCFSKLHFILPFLLITFKEQITLMLKFLCLLLKKKQAQMESLMLSPGHQSET